MRGSWIACVLMVACGGQTEATNDTPSDAGDPPPMRDAGSGQGGSGGGTLGFDATVLDWSPPIDACPALSLAGPFDASDADGTCSTPLPVVPEIHGDYDPSHVALQLVVPGREPEFLLHVRRVDECGNELHWTYDDRTMPMRIVLCPALCAAVRDGGEIRALIGCETNAM